MTGNCGCGGNAEGGGGTTPFRLVERVQYAPDAIVSTTIADNDAGTLTLFALDAGQGLSTHSAPFDAIVQIVDGEAEITVADEEFTLAAGDMLVMPADVPHSVRARKAFKMVLTMFRA